MTRNEYGRKAFEVSKDDRIRDATDPIFVPNRLGVALAARLPELPSASRELLLFGAEFPDSARHSLGQARCKLLGGGGCW